MFGMVLAVSSSSTAFSSIESEVVVDTLPRRSPNWDVVDGGELPESPKVVIDSRRRWSRAAAAAAESLTWPLPAEVELLRWKRLENATEVTDPRRLALPFGWELLVPSLDMMGYKYTD